MNAEAAEPQRARDESPARSDWVLLRGLARESAHWGQFPAALMATVVGATWHAIDLIGTGDAFRARSPASVKAIAADVIARLDTGRATTPVDVRSRAYPTVAPDDATGNPPTYLIGLSLGGMVAIECALRAPQRFAGVVLINTSARPWCPPWQRLDPRRYGDLLRVGLMRRDPLAAERIVLRFSSNRHAGDEALAQAWAGIRTARPVSACNAIRQLIAAVRYRAPDAAPPLPVLLLASRGDRLVDPRCSIAIAERWRSPLALHPDAGHDLPLDDPDWVAERIFQWLANDPGVASGANLHGIATGTCDPPGSS